MIGLYDRLTRFYRALGALCVITMIAVLLAAIVMREVMALALVWANEVSITLFVWSVFLGAGVAIAENAHIRFNMMVERLPLAGRRSVGLFVSYVGLALLVGFWLISIYVTWVYRGQVFTTIATSVAWEWAAVPVGMLVKLGGYGFLRFVIPILPVAVAHYSKTLAVLAVIAIIYGALVALVQRDMKKLVAYSSLSHMGFVLLGLASLTVIGAQGAVLQMVNLGITTTAVFLMIGMLQDRSGTTMIADFGGVASRMPVLTGFWIVAAMASIGLPLTNGFVGEFLIFNGAFTSGFAWGRMAACLATLGVLLAAAYMLWMTKKVFWGAENPDPDGGTAKLAGDLSFREIVVLVPLTALILWIGVHPRTFLSPSERPVAQLLSDAQAPAPRWAPQTPAQAPAPSEVHE